MAIANSLRKLLDRKEWEMMTPSPVATAAGAFTITDPSGEDKAVMLITGVSSIIRYDHNHDGWQALPNSGIAGTFAAGACGCFHPYGPSGAATAGTTLTLSTNHTINRSLKGYKVRFTAGPNAGLTRTIASNTLGANSVLTFTEALPVAITTATNYIMLTGRYWFFNAGTAAVGLAYYDRALNAWTQRGVVGVPTAWGTEGRLVVPFLEGISFASGQATAGGATTLTNSAKTWTVNQWTNYQVRITGGTGVGQVRRITSNTANTLTVASAWTTNPDATSTYTIEGDEDALYLLGNNVVTMYKYSISGNSWATITPGVARGGALAVGGGANWIYNVSDKAWKDENAIQNGRYIYSFRGGGVATLDVYDIAANSWSAKIYTPQVDTFNTGSCYDYDDDFILISKENTGRIFRFIIAENRLIPFSTLMYPQGTAIVGDKMWTKTITDGSTILKWVYHLRHTGAELFRCLMIDTDVS